MAHVEWVEPVLTWPAQARLNELRKPRIVEIRSDDFMEEFLQAMNGKVPHAYLQSHLAPAPNQAVKLFQPLHGCYYLVTGSLVCRQVGLPDRDVKRNAGEATGFVVRRKVGGIEQGWVNEGPQRGWNAVDFKHGLVGEEEEVLPLHPVKVCTAKTPGLAPYRVNGTCERMVYHGYVPVGNFDKYTAQKKYLPAAGQVSREEKDAANAALFSAYLTEVYNDDTAGLEDKDGGFRASEFDTRVIGPWLEIEEATAATDPRDALRQAQAAYYVVLDLADFVARALPDVWEAIKKFYRGEPNPKANITGAKLDLLNRLLNEDDEPDWNIANDRPLGTAMFDVHTIVEVEALYLMPVSDSVPTSYKLDPLLKTADIPPQPVLKNMVIAALGETPATQMQVSDEFAELVSEQVRVPKPEASAQYFIRLIYTYDPECPPHVSQPSDKLIFSRFFDADAPARKVRIEAPKLADLRKFKPGVGIAMDPDLRDVLNRVHKGLKDGDPLLDGSANWELGMICSFSIQIVFLVAFIVMFIFLILLNIVFWWLPFLKICLPIPKPK